MATAARARSAASALGVEVAADVGAAGADGVQGRPVARDHQREVGGGAGVDGVEDALLLGHAAGEEDELACAGRRGGGERALDGGDDDGVLDRCAELTQAVEGEGAGDDDRVGVGDEPCAAAARAPRRTPPPRRASRRGS